MAYIVKKPNCLTVNDSSPSTSNQNDEEKQTHNSESVRKFGLKIADKRIVIRVANKKDLLSNSYFCKQCSDVYFKKIEDLQAHMTENHEQVKKCLHCGASFVSNRAHVIHCRSVHGDTLGFKCFCGKQFTTRQYLNLHARTHQIGDRFYCPECGHWYRSKEELSKHISYCGETVNRHECEFCSKTFKFPRDKIQHEKTHTGQRPFTCKHCHSRFTQLSALNVHERIHANEKTYKCRFCPSQYTNSSAVRRHELNTHFKESPMNAK